MSFIYSLSYENIIAMNSLRWDRFFVIKIVAFSWIVLYVLPSGDERKSWICLDIEGKVSSLIFHSIIIGAIDYQNI